MMSSFLDSDLKIINFISCIIGSAFPLSLFLQKMLKLLFFTSFYTPRSGAASKSGSTSLVLSPMIVIIHLLCLALSKK